MGLLRIPSEQLGVHPSNRGGLGVHPYHGHEVGCDIMTNGLKLSRDDHVKVMQIPRNQCLPGRQPQTSVEEEASEVDEAARSAEARTKTAGEEKAVSREGTKK